MTLRLKFVPPVAVLQRYPKFLKSYTSTGRAEEGSNHRNGKVRASATAYEILGLSEECSPSSIRMAFRELAKATHPDLQSEPSTVEFIRVLAAYEILSDPQKREQYDENLRLKRAERSRTNASEFGEHNKGGYDHRSWEEQEPADRTTEVVSWLRSYRVMVKDIIRRRPEIGVGRGWEEDLRLETQSALRKAYFGPPVSEREGLPECFEAEERAQPDLLDVLHLVSGRQLFGVVRQVHVPLLRGKAHESPSLLHAHTNTVENNLDTKDPVQSVSGRELHTKSSLDSQHADDAPGCRPKQEDLEESAFVDLELQVFGSVVARSVRLPPTETSSDSSFPGDDEKEDCIYVYLSSEQDVEYASEADSKDDTVKRDFLGSIHGLGSSKVGSVANVYGPDGKKTHLVLQHRTPGVKHMQWFRIGDDGSPCECRCRRATVLPSRYWIFEPRADTHNVGGWYIETFGRNRRPFRRSVKRRGVDQAEERLDGKQQLLYSPEMGDGKMLHPAMYILAAAYKTLDEEAARRRKGSLSTRLKTWSSSLSGWWLSRWSPS